jgi:protein-disulfide isomerase
MDRNDRGLPGLRTSLELVTTLVLLAASLAVLSDRTGGVGATRTGGTPPPPPPPPPVELPADPVSLAGAALKGSESASVAIIEFAEFECPYCLRFVQNTLPALTTKYIDTGRVLFALRHFPLETIHQDALGASEAAECAGRQGRFWEMHDAIFRRPAQLARPTLLGRAGELALDMEAFEACLAGEAIDAIRRDQALGQAVGIRGTPAFLVGLVQDDGTVRVTHRVSGARALADYEAVLDEALALAASPDR